MQAMIIYTIMRLTSLGRDHLMENRFPFKVMNVRLTISCAVLNIAKRGVIPRYESLETEWTSCRN